MELNFASIHTASSTFTHALYTLAAHPEWITPLRAEIEPIVAAEGMTKAGLQQMAKLDSFLRECSRRHPFLSSTSPPPPLTASPLTARP
jgi:cytochrome P450